MAVKSYLKTMGVPVFVAAVLLLSLSGKAFPEAEAPGSVEQNVISSRGSEVSDSMDRNLEDAEQCLQSRNFGEARDILQKVLETDSGNLKARKMLAKLDQEEVLQQGGKAPSFFARIFSSGKSHKAVTGNKKGMRIDRCEEYLEKARESLEEESFTAARDYAVKAAEYSDGGEESRELILEIDKAEGLFREKYNVPPGKNRRFRRPELTSAEEYIRERQKYEERKKLEDLVVRENIIRSRELLEQGNYKKARKTAYKAWKKIPYDTEVAILIANINKAFLLGPEGLETDLSESNELIEPAFPGGKDPMEMYPKTDGFGDVAGSLIKGVKDFFRKETFEMGYEYPTLEYSLDDCVEVALIMNRRMKFAEEQVKLGETRIWELRRKLFPDVALKVEKSFGKIADSTTGAQDGATRHYQGAKYMAEVKHTVFDGFGTYYEVKQAQANLEVIKMEKARIRNDIVEETKRAYYNLDKTKKAGRVQKKIASRISELYEVARKAYEKGLVPAVEYLKVKGLNMQTEFQTISSGRDQDLAHLVLTQAMNADPDRPVQIKELKRPSELLQIGLQNCYNLAVANSPDLKIKEKTIDYYNFEREMSKAKGWPKVDFIGNFGKAIENYQPMRYAADWGGTNPIRAHRGLSPEWYAGIKGSVPLGGSTFEYNYVREFWAPTVSAFRGSESATSYFTLHLLDNLAYFTGVQESEVGFERSKYEYQKAKNDLAMQVKTAYFKYRKALLQMDVAVAQVEHQKMFVAVLEERRKFGEMDLSRLVEEYIKLGEHEYGEVHGDSEYYISITEINKAVGVMGYFHPWETVSGERQRSAAFLAEKYLMMARAELVRKEFENARNLVVQAADVDEANDEAKSLLGMIDRSEALHREGKGSGRYSQ